MLSNTLTLTVAGATGSPFTLLRNGEQNGASRYFFRDATQEVTLLIRQTEETEKGLKFYRHNLTLNHLVYGTPTTAEKKATCTVTLRDSLVYGPAALLSLWQGFNTLVLAQDDSIVAGDL